MPAQDVNPGNLPGFGGHAGAGERPALLLVDITRGFTEAGSALACDAEATVAANIELLAAARDAGAPVVFTSVVLGAQQRQAAAHFLRKMPALLELGDAPHLSEIDPRLQPRDDEPVLPKIFPSAFFETPLADLLTKKGVDTVVVTGLSTSGCVRASAVDALQYGFTPIVPREAVGDRDATAHASNLRDLELKYADVVPLQEAVAYLRASWAG